VLRLGMAGGPIELVGNAAPGRHTVELVHRTETWLGAPEIRGFVTDGILLPPRRRRRVNCWCWATPSPAAPIWNARPATRTTRVVECAPVLRHAGGDVRWTPRCSWCATAGAAWCAAGTDAPTSCQLPPSTAGDRRGRRPYSIKWKQADYDPDLILVAIGTNDFTQGIPERAAYVAAYESLRAHAAARACAGAGRADRGRDPEWRKEGGADGLYERGRPEQRQRRRVHYLPSLHHPGDALDAHPTTAQHAAMARELAPPLRR
jgi:hypothetical protein